MNRIKLINPFHVCIETSRPVIARPVSSIDIKQMAEQLKRDSNSFIIDTKVTHTRLNGSPGREDSLGKLAEAE